MRSRASLVAACIAVLVVGLIGLLVLTVSLGRGAYEMRTLRAQTTQLAEQRQALQEEIDALQAPQRLAARAISLGMVPAPNVAMIRRSDGAVLGSPKAAAGQPAPVTRHPARSSSAEPPATPKPGASPSPSKPAAKPAAKPSVRSAKPPATPSPAR